MAEGVLLQVCGAFLLMATTRSSCLCAAGWALRFVSGDRTCGLSSAAGCLAAAGKFANADLVVPGQFLVLDGRFQRQEQTTDVCLAELEASSNLADRSAVAPNVGDSPGAIKIVEAKPICL